MRLAASLALLIVISAPAARLAAAPEDGDPRLDTRLTLLVDHATISDLCWVIRQRAGEIGRAHV